MLEKVTVVGAGVSGRALALFSVRQGMKVFVTDARTELPQETEKIFREHGIEWETGAHTPRCCECDALVLSSGVPPKSQAVLLARKAGISVFGELDFLAPYFEGKIIAVTGTNGKTTCTSMINCILKANGIDAIQTGNIGEALADHATEKHDAFVMELSSFQLHWNTLLKPDVAVMTNLAPDHIDWHRSYENYIADKCKIFLPKDVCFAVIHEREASRVPQGRQICVLGEGTCCISVHENDIILRREGRKKLLFKREDLKLLGRHNLENAAMSAAAAALAFPEIDPSFGLASFQPPRHRCEKVAVRGGVLYINDSKATNVTAVTTALRSIDGRKIVILGGQGKGESYIPLAQAVKENAFSAIVLGSEAQKILTALRETGYKNAILAENLNDAVKKASDLAHEGDCVLLSPACTSWDTYKNYEERGDHFAELVRQLPERI